MSNNVEKITKQEAAKRQLKTAIRLFFENADSVSVHSLTAAAHGVLRDLLTHGGKGSFIKDNPALRPNRKKEYLQIINEAQNFFKHADKDPTTTLEFKPQTTEFFIFDACLMYNLLTGRHLGAGMLFLVWFYIQNPKLLIPGTPLSNHLDAMRPNYEHKKKGEYLDFWANAENVPGADV